MSAPDDNGVVWEEPPLPRTKGIWLERLAPLVEHPGEWARVHETSSQIARNTAGNLTRGVLMTPPGQWEFAARTVDGKGRVYARYLGPEVVA